MMAAGQKLKDEIIGGQEFSRVKRFDDEARKSRIFAPNAATAIDVDKLEEQVKEKERRKQLEKFLADEEEKRRALEKENWTRADEELRKARIEARSALERCWSKQDEEFKQRWKHEICELNPEKVGLIPAKRYQLQDGEAVREANTFQRISEAWRQQIEAHNSRMRMEQEEREKDNSELTMARNNWEKTEAEIAKKLFDSNVELANEYLRLSKEKTERERRLHNEEHLYTISKEYFQQFETSSR